VGVITEMKTEYKGLIIFNSIMQVMCGIMALITAIYNLFNFSIIFLLLMVCCKLEIMGLMK